MAKISRKHFLAALARISDQYPLREPALQQKREDLYEQAVREHGLPCGPERGFVTLLGKGYKGPEKPRFGDHLEIFKEGKERVLISHLYPDNFDLLKGEIERFCSEERLRYEVLEQSWHVPGWTVAIAFRRDN